MSMGHCPTALQITAQNMYLPDASRSSRIQVRAEHKEFSKKVELPNGSDDSYVCIRAKASDHFMTKKPQTRARHNKVEYIVTHRQRCWSGDQGRGAWSAGTRQESIRVDLRTCAARRFVERCPLTTSHLANKREHEDEASHLVSRRDAHPEADARACKQQRRGARRGPVHDRRKPSRARRKVQTAVFGAARRGRSSSKEVFLATYTRGPDTTSGTHDQVKKRVAGRYSRQSTMPRTQAWKKSATRKLLRKTLCVDEETLTQWKSTRSRAVRGGDETRSGGAVHHVQHVDKHQDSFAVMKRLYYLTRERTHPQRGARKKG